MKLQELISALQEYIPAADVELVRRAYAFVRQSHQGQIRASGEPFLTHVTEVAFLATKLRLDLNSIAAALLHDTVEDTKVTQKEIEKEFGHDIALLVDGVTKLSQVNFSSRAEAQAENFRKMLLAMARDIRVLLIKLCDRTHNMRTLEFLSEARRVRIAQETIDIYAPLAHRLGIYWMKSELEDLSFRYLKPEVYENIKNNVAKKRKEREAYIEQVVSLISRELEQNELKGSVSGRPKNFYSIYHKMERQGLDFNEIYDLIAFRVIVETLMECYAALGVVHAAWKPIPGRFKDYIAMPKPNGYQSLHTTVIGPHGTRVEIQIRSREMHEIAERGIAAHWLYKRDGGSTRAGGRDGLQFNWLKDLVESGHLVRDPLEFLSVVKNDLFPEEVFVFTPRGDVIALPAGATPIDFAYHIHSEVGHHCTGARVNGQQVGLSYRLQNGDALEIVTSPKQTPSKDWLKLVVTSKAKQRIRSWLKTEERNHAISVGRELMMRDLPKLKLSYNKLIKSGDLNKVAEDFGLSDVELLLAEVGYGKISTHQIATKLLPEEKDLQSKLAADETALQKIFNRAAKSLRDQSAVKVSGLEDVVFRFARCCEPLPGEPLVGYVTRGRGVVIHTRDCPQCLSFDTQRLIPVSWDENVKTERIIRLTVISRDQPGILALMSQTIASIGVNIVSAQIAAKPDGKAVSTFEVSVQSNMQLEALTRALESINGVFRVEGRRTHSSSDLDSDLGD